MSVPASASPWQPLTFGGVAAFAGAPFRRLFRTQALVATIGAVVFVWFLLVAWFPALDESVRQLPPQAGIRAGRLEWPGEPRRVLGETVFLAVGVNATGTASPGTTADLEVLLTPGALRLASLFGHWDVSYLRGWSLDLSHKEAMIWWDAWRRALIVALWIGTFLGLHLAWWLVAAVLVGPVRLLTRVLRRQVSPGGVWRLTLAAMLPAALLGFAALVLHGLHRLSLIGLLLAVVIQCLLLGIYALISPLRLPRRNRSTPATNPFNPRDQPSSRRGRRNPFAGEGRR